MRLINTASLVQKDHATCPKNEYTILSHTWAASEPTNETLILDGCDEESLPEKLSGAICQSRKDNVKWLWVDTFCIDKRSSAELSEAINSMYRWYQQAYRCYVYLDDFERGPSKEDFPSHSFRCSKWFTRGWTLQELLAPATVLFYDKKWQYLGDKKSLSDHIYIATGIDPQVLTTGNMKGYSVAQKMSWASARQTTRPEDIAYCLMGLFGVHMPVLYGEAERAFIRLQEEIIRYNDDHSIFSWSMEGRHHKGLLAPSPECFQDCGAIIPVRSLAESLPFSMTNRGLSVHFSIVKWTMDTYLATLNCKQELHADITRQPGVLAIYLRRLSEKDQYARVNVDGHDLTCADDEFHSFEERPSVVRQVFVRQDIDNEAENHYLSDRLYGFRIPSAWLIPSITVSGGHYILNERTRLFADGTWGETIDIDVSAQRKGLQLISLGFDFDYNPICLLKDSFAEGVPTEGSVDSPIPWFDHSPDTCEWTPVAEERYIYRPVDHRGAWAIRGDRVLELDVSLAASPSHNATGVVMERVSTPHGLVWEVNIDDFGGPFASPNTIAFENYWIDRRNFQAAFGLKNTVQDDSEGDAILDAFEKVRAS